MAIDNIEVLKLVSEQLMKKKWNFLLVYLCVARSYLCLGGYAGKKKEKKLVNKDSELSFVSHVWTVNLMTYI